MQNINFEQNALTQMMLQQSLTYQDELNWRKIQKMLLNYSLN